MATFRYEKQLTILRVRYMLGYRVTGARSESCSTMIGILIKLVTNRYPNMAMHVPKAPGFAQMLKDGAKVYLIDSVLICLTD